MAQYVMRIDKELAQVFLHPGTSLQLINMVLAQPNEDHGFGDLFHKAAMYLIFKNVEIIFGLHGNNPVAFLCDKRHKIVKKHH